MRIKKGKFYFRTTPVQRNPGEGRKCRMQCEFCHREATTTIHKVLGTEVFHVCDFCEEEVIRCEIQELLPTHPEKTHLSTIQSKVALFMKTPS